MTTRISHEEWTRTPSDYRGTIDKRPHLLALDRQTGATVLEPVEISDDPSSLADLFAIAWKPYSRKRRKCLA